MKQIFIFIALLLVILYSKRDKITRFFSMKEMLTNQYTKTVDINPNPCPNFCGTQNTCAITKEQCSFDTDCKGCEEIEKMNKNDIANMNAEPYIENENNYYILNEEPITTPYQGKDIWTKSFNEGMQLYIKKANSADEYKTSIYYGTKIKTNTNPYAEYPMSVSATGLFYNTTPPPYN